MRWTSFLLLSNEVQGEFIFLFIFFSPPRDVHFQRRKRKARLMNIQKRQSGVSLPVGSTNKIGRFQKERTRKDVEGRCVFRERVGESMLTLMRLIRRSEEFYIFNIHSLMAGYFSQFSPVLLSSVDFLLFFRFRCINSSFSFRFLFFYSCLVRLYDM